MFKIQPKTDTFNANVQFKDLDANGRSVSHSIEMELKRLTRKDWDKAIAASEPPKDEYGEPVKLVIEDRLELEADMVFAMVASWKVQDKDGEPFPMTRENVIAMLNSYPSLALAIVNAGGRNLTGELARKN